MVKTHGFKVIIKNMAYENSYYYLTLKTNNLYVCNYLKKQKDVSLNYNINMLTSTL